MALHLAVLVSLLLAWHRPPPLAVTPIPIKLVFAPPPAPKPKPKPKLQELSKALPKTKPAAKAAPPHGRLASADIGDTKPQDLGSQNREGPEAKSPAAPEKAEPEKPKPEKPKGEKPKPEKPKPPPEPVPKPKPSKKTLLAGLPPPLDVTPRRTEDVPWPLPLSPSRRQHHHALRHEARRETTHIAKYPGPSATRSAYLAYLAVLTRRHLDLLPSSLIAGRHGETVLNIQVLDDGTIARISVAKSSGYPDIDRRVEDMIAAVGRFPPIPQWFQGDRVDLKFRLRFPLTAP